jgi:hypothetical protein
MCCGREGGRPPKPGAVIDGPCLGLGLSLTAPGAVIGGGGPPLTDPGAIADTPRAVADDPRGRN